MLNLDLINKFTANMNHAESVIQLLHSNFDENNGDFSINQKLISNAFGCVMESLNNARESINKLCESIDKEEEF